MSPLPPPPLCVSFSIFVLRYDFMKLPHKYFNRLFFLFFLFLFIYYKMTLLHVVLIKIKHLNSVLSYVCNIQLDQYDSKEASNLHVYYPLKYKHKKK